MQIHFLAHILTLKTDTFKQSSPNRNPHNPWRSSAYFFPTFPSSCQDKQQPDMKIQSQESERKQGRYRSVMNFILYGPHIYILFLYVLLYLLFIFLFIVQINIQLQKNIWLYLSEASNLREETLSCVIRTITATEIKSYPSDRANPSHLSGWSDTVFTEY